MFTHDIHHVDIHLGDRKVHSFRVRTSFSKTAFAGFRAFVKAVNPRAKFVRDTTVAGAHYTMPDGSVYELR